MNYNLEIGKYYHLTFNSPWGEYDVKDVKVIGITTEKESSKFGIDSIYSEFFSSYKLGLSNYVSLINACPDMYVCEIVKNKDPIESGKTLAIIPKLIINFISTEELLLCDNISININGLLKFNELVYNRGSFLESLVSDVKNNIRKLSEFGDVATNVSFVATDILKLESEYLIYDDIRNNSFLLQKMADTANNIKTREDLSLMISKSDELDYSKKIYEEKNLELNNVIALYNATNVLYKKMITDLHTEIHSLFNGLEDGTVSINGASYNTYKSTILTVINDVNI